MEERKKRKMRKRRTGGWAWSLKRRGDYRPLASMGHSHKRATLELLPRVFGVLGDWPPSF